MALALEIALEYSLRHYIISFLFQNVDHFPRQDVGHFFDMIHGTFHLRLIIWIVGWKLRWLYTDWMTGLNRFEAGLNWNWRMTR